MKTLPSILLLCLLLFSGNELRAQYGNFDGQNLRFQPNASPLFGKDITIYDDPNKNQSHVALCSAFNGWLYAAHSSDSADWKFADIFKSTDNGITWNRIVHAYASPPGVSYAEIDLVVIGNTVPDLKVFIGSTFVNDESNFYTSAVTRFNGVTGGAYEDELLKDLSDIHDVSLAIDFPYPANNSNPSSLAVLYSVSRLFGPDSVILRTSSNGGMSLDDRKVLAISNKHLHKVSCSYGRSSSWNSGNYFAAWEQQESRTSTLGHIFSSHTISGFNSPFSPPVCLDSLDPTMINMVRNPSISCQINNADNDSANLTEIILFEKYKPTDQDFDVTGFFNLQSTTSSHFRKLDVAVTSNNELQPDIAFNPFDSTFMATYYDSTSNKLPFVTNNFNLLNPDNWTVLSPFYNDDLNLSAPNPKVQLCNGQNKGGNVWIRELGSGIGSSMFDATYSTYTGIHKYKKESGLFKVYPNPCTQNVSLEFELQKTESVSIKIINSVGKVILSSEDQILSGGKHILGVDVSIVPPGSYIIFFNTGISTYSEKLIIIK